MSIINNIAFFLLISLIISCSSSETMKIIDETDVSFFSEDSVYKITPSYKIESSQFSVALDVEKIKDVGEYYFPSSEQLRVILKDMKGKTILNTGGAGANFLAEVTAFEPQAVGEKRGYAYKLTGISLFDERDEIELYLILPVKPEMISYRKKIKIER